MKKKNFVSDAKQHLKEKTGSFNYGYPPCLYFKSRKTGGYTFMIPYDLNHFFILTAYYLCYMLKQFVAACMLLIFMIQTFSNTLIVADYYINTDSFAINCENKNKPQLHCNGQCQMTKQLEKESKKDQTNPDRKSENKVEIISSKSFYAEINETEFFNTVQYSFDYNIGKPIHRSTSIFHPPCVS